MKSRIAALTVIALGLGLASQAQAQTAVGGTPPNYGYDTLQSDMPFGVEVGSQTVTAADLTVNRLSLLGGVQPGADTEACNASSIGTIRHSAGLVFNEMCNGTNWVPIDPPGTLCGSVFTEYDNGSCTQVQLTQACEGVQLMTACNIATLVCPQGYSPIQTGYSWGNANGYIYQYFNFSCAKN